MVVTWKFRDEQGGRFGRARLDGTVQLARVLQRLVRSHVSFRGSTDASAPSDEDRSSTLHPDVKDAFLLMGRPAEIVTENGKYKLRRNLPGQRNAAAQWFKGFCAVAKEYGMMQDVTQPATMKNVKKPGSDEGTMYLTIHVDDLLIVGEGSEVEKFIQFMPAKTWQVEKRGPIYAGSFNYLKRSMETIDEGIAIRANKEHIKELARVTGVESKKPRTTAGDGNFNQLSRDDEALPAESVTKFRSVVGKLLHIAPGQMFSLLPKAWQA